jgi:hypothetical protein
MNRRIRLFAISALVVLASSTLTAPTASAQDEEAAPVELTLSAMGIGNTLSLSGTGGRTQMTVPVTPGTTPQTLFATALVPVGLGRGWLDVSSQGRSVARVDLPEGVTTVPFSAPLSGLAVADNALTVDISTVLVPVDGYCLATPDDSTVRIVDASVGFAGQPAIPADISEFLPPVLSQLTVYVPDQPDADQSSAAVALTTAVIDRYGAQPLRVRLLPESQLSSAPVDGPFQRSVVVQPNTDGSAQLIYPTEPAPPTLFVSGSGSALDDQVRMITSSLSALAVSTAASAGASSPPPTLSSDSMTLDDLGVGTVTATGSGSVTATVPVDQTRLGRAAGSMSVHLLGSYTPLPDDLGGSIVVSVGEKTLAVLPVDNAGRIDQWVDIPGAVASRVTDLAVTLRTSTGQNGCGTGGSATVTVDGDSSVTSSASGTPSPSGFASLPQALMPRVDVALGQQNFADTARAVTLLGGLQRLSAVALAPRVVPMDDAVDGDSSAVVVAADDDVPDSITLPLRTDGDTTFTVGGQAFRPASGLPAGSAPSASLTVDGAMPYGSLQVVREESGTTMLVASSRNAPDQLDRTLGWLDADPSRWFALSGDVLFASGTGDPVALSSAELAGPADTAAPADSSQSSPPIVRTLVLVGVGLFVLALIAAGVIVLRSRGRRE